MLVLAKWYKQNKIMEICHLMRYKPNEISTVIDVVRVNKHASAQDIRQFAENGIPINSYLLDYYNKRNESKMDIEELFAIIRDKKVTYNDIINAFKDKGYKNI